MKCAPAACKCEVPEDREFGNYCSEHCRQIGDKTELRCECRHPVCRE